MSTPPSDPWSVPAPPPAGSPPAPPPPGPLGGPSAGQPAGLPGGPVDGSLPGFPGSPSTFTGGPSAYTGGPFPDPRTGLPAPVEPGPVIVQIAEIAVTSSLIRTPAGDLPLAGSQWQVNDFWFSSQRIPRWAILCAIFGFCVLTVFSLLFLLARETVMQGTVQITVTNGTRQYVARIPVTDQGAVNSIHQQINYVRTLAAL
jgi:hypothetical protein